MARHEADREDLFGEAVAMNRRFAGRLHSAGPTIVAGFRQTGWLSIYLGADPVYQFDADGRLRRAFRDGLLYRTQGSTLARLRRERTPQTTELLRTDLQPDELDEFRQRVYSDLRPLAVSLETGRFLLDALIPPADLMLAHDVAAHLRRVFQAEPWLSPAIAGKR